MALTLTPAADPTYLAYLRSLGLEESEAVGEAERRVSSLTRGLTRRRAASQVAEGRAQESTSEDFEGRGLLRSGARLVAQQRLGEDFMRGRLEDELGTREGVADAYGGLARDVAGLRRRRAESELDARDRLGA